MKLSRKEKNDFLKNYEVEEKDLSFVFENDYVKLFNDEKLFYVVDKKERMVVDCFKKENIENVEDVLNKRYNGFKFWDNDIILR